MKRLTPLRVSLPIVCLATLAIVVSSGVVIWNLESVADPPALFIARGRGYTLHLTATGAVMALRKISGSPDERKEGSTWLRMSLQGAHPEPFLVGRDRIPGVSNYFVGDRESWGTGVPHFARVQHTDVYPGIDIWWRRL